jgi:pyruvate/2-oxoglutarate dehydrogenase complex dihydrolipoamide dehydrogenase (E3) component
MFDVIVIGGGPAGVTAALRARELGASVALAERGRLGGTCTNDGCVPTRVLAKTARLMRETEHFGSYGLSGQKPALDFPQLLAYTRLIVETVHKKKRLGENLHQAGVRHFTGGARFVDGHTLVLADGARIEGEKIIICAGGHARRLPFPGSDAPGVITHHDVWSLQQLPRSVAIVGAAATGCQLASILGAFGAKVALFEIAPRILATEDEMVSRAVEEAFRQDGIEVVTGIAGVERIEAQANGMLRLVYRHGEEASRLDTEAVVLAVGWVGNLDELGLSAAGVETGRGYILVNDQLQTSVPHIFAAGDITGRVMLVQTANDDGRHAAENAVLETGHGVPHPVIPHGGFTDPEYAGVGLTEQQARSAEKDCVVTTVPYAGLDRAVIDGHTEGFCKLIASRTSRRILGAHVVGEQAVEVVQLAAAAMGGQMRVEQLADLELAYPTFTAIIELAAQELVRQMGAEPLPASWRCLGEKTTV